LTLTGLLMEGCRRLLPERLMPSFRIPAPLRAEWVQRRELARHNSSDSPDIGLGLRTAFPLV
jgi:hypothetical protein